MMSRMLPALTPVWTRAALVALALAIVTGALGLTSLSSSTGPTTATGGNSITSPDAEDNNGDTFPDDVGASTSLALDVDGYPVVSYSDGTNDDLKVLHCNDPNCEGGDESITSPDTVDRVGVSTSLALDDLGNPVVSYYDSSTRDLKVLHCNDPNCAGAGESIESPDKGGDVGSHTSLVLDDFGNPVVSHWNASPSYDLKVLHCSDPNCAGEDESIESPDTVGDVGSSTSLALDVDGYPVVSYSNYSDGDLKLLHCNDPNCDDAVMGPESIEAPDTFALVGAYTSLALDGVGNPVVSYYDIGEGNLKVMHCNDPNCAGGDESIESPDTVGDVGGYTSLALDGVGNPVVSYYEYTNGNLKVLHCNDPNCADGDESIESPDRGGAVGRYSSLVLDDFGNPVVSYYDLTNGDLKVLHCGDPNCTSAPTCLDRDGDTACRDATNDVDDDGCTAAQEADLGTDPNAWYDVFDVPVPAVSDSTPNGPRNRYIDMGDVLAVLFYVFADQGGPPNPNGVSYDSTKGMSSPHIDPPQNLVVGMMYDRTPGDPDPDGAGPFIDPAGPPNGVIDPGDVLIVLAQANLVDCT